MSLGSSNEYQARGTRFAMLDSVLASRHIDNIGSDSQAKGTASFSGPGAAMSFKSLFSLKQPLHRGRQRARRVSLCELLLLLYLLGSRKQSDSNSSGEALAVA